MSISTYTYISAVFLVSLISHAGISFQFFKKNGVITGLILSILILSCLTCPLAFINTVYIKPIVTLYTCVGLFLFLKNRRSINRPNKIHLLNFLIFLTFFLFYFRNLSPDLYIFDDHDLLYFSWIGEFMHSSISGPIKLDISWPNQMAGNHLLPGSVIAIMSVFQKKITLISSITFRYLVVSCYFAYFFSKWSMIKLISPIKLIILIVLTMSVFGQDIGYSLKISSFLYVILLLEILKNLFLSENQKNVIYISLFLIISKAPIFFVATILSIWIVYLYKIKFTKMTWFISILVSLNFLSWFLVPAPKEHGGRPFIINIFRLEDILSLTGIKGWFITDNLSEFMYSFSEGPVIIFLLLIYILIKYYLPYFLITKNIKAKKELKKIIVIDSWVLLSILGWAFLRYPIGIGHTAHLYILMSVITLFFVIKYLLDSKNLFTIIALIPIAFFYGYPHKLLDPFAYVENDLLKIPESTMRLKELKFGYLDDTANENYAVKNQIRSAMIGEKIDAYSTRPAKKSVMYNWIIQNDSK